jgi:hypothetical protein
MIDGRKIGPIGARNVLNLDLCRHWRTMRFTQRGQFRRPRPHLDAARSAIEAHPIDGRRVVDDSVVVDVVHNGRIHVINRAVVIEVTTVPVAALVPDANVTEAIIDPSVEADVRAPIATEELIMVMAITPVARGPKRTLVGSLNPDSGHPVVASWRIAPIARRPEIIVAGSRRLVVGGQRRRRLGSRSNRLLTIVRVTPALVRS